jgi:hypothetical protein
MKWKKGLPTKDGYYWYRDPLQKHDSEPRILHIRDYAGRLALDNSALEGWDRMERADWAGPIPLPEDEG